MTVALILAASIAGYSTGWFFVAMCMRDKDDMEALILAGALGIFPIPIAFWYGFCRPKRHERARMLADDLQLQAVAIERMSRAVNSIPAEKWQVVRAEHLDQIVEKLTNKPAGTAPTT